VTKRGGRVDVGGVTGWDAGSALAALPDGAYTFALRPHHVLPEGAANGAAGNVRVEGPVSIAEISGSESVVHFDLDGHKWVSQSHGIHRFAVGETARFRLDVARGLFFAADGTCVFAGTA